MSAITATRSSAGLLAATFGLGAAVAIGLGSYGKLHDPTFKPLLDLSIPDLLNLKAWLATLVIVLLVLQLITALWMWGRLPGAGPAPGWASQLHRWSGTAAFVVSLPVAFHCLWALGFADTDARVLVHSLAGCLFYGAYAAKMLGLRSRRLPGWTIPVLGGSLFTLLIATWLTSALWLFTQPGITGY